MKNQMNKQKGFTLIELIIVIVILGILAVTAAPRFIDLQSDARAKTLDGVKAALQGASQLVFAKAAIAGKIGDATETVSLNGTPLPIVYGYPDAEPVTDLAGVQAFLDLSSGDFAVISTATDTNFVIAFVGEDETDGCFIRYTNAAEGAAPTIVVEDVTGC